MTKEYLESGGHFRVKGWSNLYLISKIGAVKMLNSDGSFYPTGFVKFMNDHRVIFKTTYMGQEVTVELPFSELVKADV